VLSAWGARGYETGGLGYPVSDTFCGLTDGGCFQRFQGGSLYGSASTPVVPVIGAIRDRWGASGWENGALGYPTGPEVCSAGACEQPFQRGSIRWTPAGGAVVR
ncbi:LGFP repeat-containing protein, partial [Klenkia sp. PcliD-1-E]|uniref:LGFP repeat-containing protein n=1 Tax=Klenkia sp. PcliD-1-E TaxID=2954492 RepID=UPI0035AC1F97|nr:hypothetical protein [Klenkia sp. PcliD-1-E]